jgi:hypothetical protein
MIFAVHTETHNRAELLKAKPTKLWRFFLWKPTMASVIRKSSHMKCGADRIRE